MFAILGRQHHHDAHAGGAGGWCIFPPHGEVAPRATVGVFECRLGAWGTDIKPARHDFLPRQSIQGTMHSIRGDMRSARRAMQSIYLYLST